MKLVADAEQILAAKKLMHETNPHTTGPERMRLMEVMRIELNRLAVPVYTIDEEP